MTSAGDFQRNSIFGDPWRARYRTAALIWAAALLIGSLQPSRPANIHAGPLHHVVHVLGFGTLAFLATAGFGTPRRNSLWPAAASFLIGFAIEFLQHWQNGIPVEWYDVWDDAIGVFAFTVVYYTLYRATATYNG